jgi:hypothetical protein
MKQPILKAKPTDNSYESYLAWQDGKIILFRKPPAARRLETLLAVAITIQIVAFPLVGAVLTGKLIFFGASALGAGWVLWFLYRIAGPNGIRLDGEQRTYEWTTGWPWKPETRIGSFADIKGVCISPRNSVIILMAKRQGLLKRVVVSDPAMSSIRSTALTIDRSHVGESRALAEELNRVYGFPIVPYPKT